VNIVKQAWISIRKTHTWVQASACVRAFGVIAALQNSLRALVLGGLC